MLSYNNALGVLKLDARVARLNMQGDLEKRQMQPPVVETERFTLRGFGPWDIDRLAEILGDPLVMRYMPGDEPWPRDAAVRELGSVIEHWGRHGYGRWAVVDKEDDRMIGWCGLGFLPEIDDQVLTDYVRQPADKVLYPEGYGCVAIGQGFLQARGAQGDARENEIEAV